MTAKAPMPRHSSRATPPTTRPMIRPVRLLRGGGAGGNAGPPGNWPYCGAPYEPGCAPPYEPGCAPPYEPGCAPPYEPGWAPYEPPYGPGCAYGSGGPYCGAGGPYW